MFGWIRARVKSAILDGVADALAALESADVARDDNAALTPALAERFRPALPSGETAADDAPARQRKRA